MTDEKAEFDAEKNIETWESVFPGTVWLLVRDPRDSSGYKKVRVGGRQGGSKRVRLSTDDRRYNQEQVVDEMSEHDPFTSGALRLVDEKHADDVNATYHLTNADLEEFLALKDTDLFTQQVNDIKSELIVRRLYAIAEKSGTGTQVEIIRDIIDERYGFAKSQESTLDDSKGIRLSEF
jgi:hypothetical protein